MEQVQTARALLAERERCAKIAENVGKERADAAGFYVANLVAVAIRRPG